MNLSDVTMLSAKLHELYEDRFPMLTMPLQRIWLDALRSTDEESLDTAIMRWARQHHGTQAPTLQALLDTIDLVEEDLRAARHGRRPGQQRDTAAILLDAVSAAAPDLKNWAQAHVQLFLEGLAAAGKEHEAAQRCRDFAVQFPEEAHDWQQEAVWWDMGAPKTTRPLGATLMYQPREAYA